MKKNAALRLVAVRTLDLRQWLFVRRGGFGSSDATGAVGLCLYKRQPELWMEKTGRTQCNAHHPAWTIHSCTRRRRGQMRPLLYFVADISMHHRQGHRNETRSNPSQPVVREK